MKEGRCRVHVAARAPKTIEQIRLLRHHLRAAKVAVGDAQRGVCLVHCNAVVNGQATVGTEPCTRSDQQDVGRGKSLR